MVAPKTGLQCNSGYFYNANLLGRTIARQSTAASLDDAACVRTDKGFVCSGEAITLKRNTVTYCAESGTKMCSLALFSPASPKQAAMLKKIKTELLKSYSKDNPSPENIAALCDTSEALGDPQLFDKAFKMARAIVPLKEKALALTEVAARKGGKYLDEAVRALKKLDDLQTQADGFLKLAKATGNEKLFEEAFNAANTPNPLNNYWQHRKIGEILRAMVDSRMFVEALKIIRKSSDSRIRIEWLCEIALTTGDTSLIAEAQKVPNAGKGDGAYTLAVTMAKMKQFDEAIRLARAMENGSAWKAASLGIIARFKRDAVLFDEAVAVAGNLKNLRGADGEGDGFGWLYQIAKWEVEAGFYEKAAEIARVNFHNHPAKAAMVLVWTAEKALSSGLIDEAYALVPDMKEPLEKASVLSEIGRVTGNTKFFDEAGEVFVYYRPNSHGWDIAPRDNLIIKNMIKAGFLDQAEAFALKHSYGRASDINMIFVANALIKAGFPDRALKLADEIVDESKKARALGEIALATRQKITELSIPCPAGKSR